MIQLLGDRVLVALPPKGEAEQQDAATGYTFRTSETTASGLVVAKPPDTFDVEVATRGIVVQVGEKKGVVDVADARTVVADYFDELSRRIAYDVSTRDVLAELVRRLEALQPPPFEVAVGDCVVFAPSAGNQFQIDDVTYVILRESEVLGIVEPVTEGV